jgi:hypothetical protein
MPLLDSRLAEVAVERHEYQRLRDRAAIRRLFRPGSAFSLGQAPSAPSIPSGWSWGAAAGAAAAAADTGSANTSATNPWGSMT